ncbi:MAG TPA: tRNA (adenosine(37)-N6)-dimethylallyltransferase MiaA [Verrucomicrobiae bacterium]|nr:tRNA (adenosine(37)-N6)-dimethylallyltransferase MiaA [Verrucomicrobiae bacterium]
MSAPSHPRSLFVAGPTAVGKSEIALELAEKVGGEIISVDSMQVYRGLDIGTAKPGAAERKRIPHHLIDVAGLTESFDAAKFVVLAEKAAAEIQSRGRTPIFCGGTGLYFNAYLSGLGETPAANPELRAELERLPFETLLHELRERDREAYGKIDKQNPRRVIRAVEAIRLTGKKFSEQRADWHSAGRTAEVGVLWCFIRPTAELHERIVARVDEMFRRGLVEETRELLKRGLEENQTAMQAIGYRQVVEHLRGERDLGQTIELVKRRTRQLAKRQLTWFRRYGNCRWIELKRRESMTKNFAEIISAR